MKAFLMERDRAFALDGKAAAKLPPNADLLVQDLELELLLQAMAQGDEFVLQVARHAILAGTRNDVATVLYRQAVLKDCLAQPGDREGAVCDCRGGDRARTQGALWAVQ